MPRVEIVHGRATHYYAPDDVSTLRARHTAPRPAANGARDPGHVDSVTARAQR